jgi:glycosyl transferase family 2
MTPRYSLVIPARNEAELLPRLLDSVDAARRSYSGGAGAIEVIVADNASTDDTAAVAAARGCRVVRVEKRIIAAVRNGGAHAARGEILAFVDADFRIHPDTFDAIDRELATGRVVGGATGTTVERWSLGIALTFLLMMSLVRLLRMNTGVVFCRRADFGAIGGYDEGRLYAEDVKLLWDLRRLGWSRRQRLTATTPAPAIASARKFDRHGEWHWLGAMVRTPAWLLFSPRRVDDFVHGYWYDR